MVKLLILTSWLWAFCSGLCVYTLVQIMIKGSITYVEPNMACLIAEVVMFSAFCIFALATFIYVIFKQGGKRDGIY